jgi:SAM-dependent methyltransferase
VAHEHNHDQLVRVSFQRQAPQVAGRSSLFAVAPTTAAPEWLAPLDDTMVVLDVACGAAHAAEQAAPFVRQVVGVDVTRALLDLGASRLRGTYITNVLLQEANAASLPFVDASFDLVMCRAAVHHFSDPETALREMARVCRPDGRVVVSDMVATSASTQRAFTAVHRSIDPSHAGCLLESELAQLLEETGGPVTDRRPMSPLSIPIDVLFNEASDRDRVVGALLSDIDGGTPTGFAPAINAEGRVIVEITTSTLHAIRRS